MFSRFRNLFSKQKSESEENVETVTSSASLENSEWAKSSSSSTQYENGSNEDTLKLDGLNLLRNVGENEQKDFNNEIISPTSLSEEVAELLQKRLSKGEINPCLNVSSGSVNTKDTDSNDFEVIQPQNNINSMLLSKDVEEIPQELSESMQSLDVEEITSNKISSGELEEEIRENKVVELESNSPENTNEKNPLELKEEISEISDSETNGKKEISSTNENLEISKSEDQKETILEVSEISIQNPEEAKEVVIQEINAESSKSMENIIESSENANVSENQTRNENKLNENEVAPEKPCSIISERVNSESVNHAQAQSENMNDIEKLNESSSTLIQSNESNGFVLKEIDNNSRSYENLADHSESSQSLSQSSITENQVQSFSQSPAQNLETNNSNNNSSIAVEDLPLEINTSSPTIDSTISSSSSSNTSTLDSSSVSDIVDPSKIIVNPIDNNDLACNAITNKLTDIAEVAESLDAVIRDVQENVQSVEIELNSNPSDKKLGTLRSTSSEDWHSRCTEEDSFVTASEGNFTPHSHSSASFQTSSGRNSSFISCDKNSFDASEADDSTLALEIPELTSPLNMSFEGSEQSSLSAQPQNSEQTFENKEEITTKLSSSSSHTLHPLEEDRSSTADIEELNSESLTPTPTENVDDDYLAESIPIESETELELAGIANAPSVDILTEHSAMPKSRTLEVSTLSSMASSNLARYSNDQQQQNTNNNNNNNSNNNSNNSNNKPNAEWRRSKYYENITKQTIKGFL